MISALASVLDTVDYDIEIPDLYESEVHVDTDISRVNSEVTARGSAAIQPDTRFLRRDHT